MGEKSRCGWEAVSSYSERVVQVSYRRGTAHPRGARFTVLVQSAKQTDQLGDISKRGWNKAGEEGINGLQGSSFQLTRCQPWRILSLPCKMPLMHFCAVHSPLAPCTTTHPLHYNLCTTTHPCAPQPVHHN